MGNTFDAEIKQLLALGQSIEAIKRYREKTGVSLGEAKAAVEALRGEASLPLPVQSDDSELTQQIVTLLQQGAKIEAVKLFMERFRVDLRQAKEAVEQIAALNHIPQSAGTGCLGVLLLIAAVTWGLLRGVS